MPINQDTPHVEMSEVETLDHVALRKFNRSSILRQPAHPATEEAVCLATTRYSLCMCSHRSCLRTITVDIAMTRNKWLVK